MFKQLIFFALINVSCGAVTTYAGVVPLSSPSAHMDADKVTPFDKKMRDAFDSINKRDLVTARTLLNQAEKLDPKSIDVQLAFAEVARLANKPDDLEASLKKALTLDPKSPDALSAWARWYFSKGDYDAAEDYMRRAIAEKPDYARLLIDLGDLYLNTRQKPVEAISFYRQAIALDTTSAGAQAGLGAALLTQGDRRGAIQAFERSAELAPKNPMPFIALARIQTSERLYKLAERNFSKSLELQPGMLGIMVERADTLLLDNQRDEAMIAYQGAIKAAPKDPNVKTKFAMALHQAGKIQEAFRAYQQALDLQPKSPLVLNNMAVLAVESKVRLTEAIGWSKKAVELAPMVLTYLDTQAWVLQTTGKLPEAVKLLDKGIAKFAPSAQLQYRRGLLMEESGKAEEALEAYRNALKIEPGFEFAKEAGNRIAKLAR